MKIQKKTLIIGAGVTGLTAANALLSTQKRAADEILVLEAADEPGGYCRTTHQDGFVWDYAGHFFHFRRPEILSWLTERMDGATILDVEKISKIHIGEEEIDFPFQKNIHQLPKSQFLECLVGLYRASRRSSEIGSTSFKSFEERMRHQLGDGIVRLFMKPYNEKLYGCDINTLDSEAMGRFLPTVDFEQLMAHFEQPDNSSYNGTFSYPLEGAYTYIEALLKDIPDGCIQLRSPVENIDAKNRIVQVGDDEIHYQELISTMPLPKLCDLVDCPVNTRPLSWNAVEVYNLGFDKPSQTDAHWIYYPESNVPFYRVGFYDNIHGSDRMSLYVEIGRPVDANTASTSKRDPAVPVEDVLAGLEKVGVIRDHELVSQQHLVMDPAYVHLKPDTESIKDEVHHWLNDHAIYSCGRYGQWRYCSIEDNIIEARELIDDSF